MSRYTYSEVTVLYGVGSVTYGPSLCLLVA